MIESLQKAVLNLSEKDVYYYIVDNSNDAAYFLQLQKICSESEGRNFFVELIESPFNKGYGDGNNLVINKLESDYHLIINPDVTVEKEALVRAVNFLEQNTSVAMLTPAIYDKNSHTSHVVKSYPDCFTLGLRYLGNNYLAKKFKKRFDRYQCHHLSDQIDTSVELAGGCFLFLRTSVFKQLHGFDEKYFMYFEDFDLSIRIRQFGQIAYVPSVKITHEGGDVGRKHWRHHLYFIMSAIRFFNQHGWKLW